MRREVDWDAIFNAKISFNNGERDWMDKFNNEPYEASRKEIMKIMSNRLIDLQNKPKKLIGEYWHYGEFHGLYEEKILDEHKEETNIIVHQLKNYCINILGEPTWIPNEDIVLYDSIHDTKRNKIKKRHDKA